jgi:hypothetical protein
MIAEKVIFTAGEHHEVQQQIERRARFGMREDVATVPL